MTLIDKECIPLKTLLGEDLNYFICKLCRDNGITMHTNLQIQKINADEFGAVSSIVLSNGIILPCDLLVIAIGSHLNTEFLTNSGFKMNDNGSIDTDIHLKTNFDNVYVGGDIANSPILSMNNKCATIGHYNIAMCHGRIAAKSMTGKVAELSVTPYHNIEIFDKKIHIFGIGEHTTIQTEGSLSQMQFFNKYLDLKGSIIK